MCKYDDELICCYGSSFVPKEENLQNSFYLGTEEYNLSKVTYFRLNNLAIINEYSLVNKLDKLSRIDRNRLFR